MCHRKVLRQNECEFIAVLCHLENVMCDCALGVISKNHIALQTVVLACSDKVLFIWTDNVILKLTNTATVIEFQQEICILLTVQD